MATPIYITSSQLLAINARVEEIRRSFPEKRNLRFSIESCTTTPPSRTQKRMKANELFVVSSIYLAGQLVIELPGEILDCPRGTLPPKWLRSMEKIFSMLGVQVLASQPEPAAEDDDEGDEEVINEQTVTVAESNNSDSDNHASRVAPRLRAPHPQSTPATPGTLGPRAKSSNKENRRLRKKFKPSATFQAQQKEDKKQRERKIEKESAERAARQKARSDKRKAEEEAASETTTEDEPPCKKAHVEVLGM
uniref:Uncharacterized protein n=1 Tax=Mycena chlorophos TaxID=658473 RepID=A0ABQ0M7A9_MYCCL|nr:predicted protein [Mycena chlorophos]